jgi:hypothetical protein
VARGVEQIYDAIAIGKLQHRRRDGDPSLLLECHPVGGGRTSARTSFHGAGFTAECSAIEKELLGQRGFARIRMADDGERTAARGLGRRNWHWSEGSGQWAEVEQEGQTPMRSRR